MSQNVLNIPQPKETTSVRMIATMGSVGCVAGILIVLTYIGTLPRIEQQKEEYLKSSVFEVLPGIDHIVTYKLSKGDKLVKVTKKGKGIYIYAGYNKKKELVGIAINAMGQGFQDTINLIYGYDPNSQRIVGMKVLESKETPGLGDKIEKDKGFLANFQKLDVSLDSEKKKLQHPIQVVKHGKKDQEWQIDAITGATISSKAIGKILDKSIRNMGPIIWKNIDHLKTGDKAGDIKGEK